MSKSWRSKRINRPFRRCFYCGSHMTRDTFTRDHVVPRSKGGGNDRKNIVYACHPCNQAKRDMSLSDYRAHCGGDPFWGEMTPLQRKHQYRQEKSCARSRHQ